MNHFDFTNLPIVPAANVLRNVGETLLRHLLQGKPPPTLSTLISAEDAKLFARPLWEPMVRRWSIYRELAPFQRILLMAEDALVRLIARGMKQGMTWHYKRTVTYSRQLSESAMEARIADRVADYTGPVTDGYIPDDFIPVVAELAWHDLGLQQRVSRQIRDLLWQRTWLYGADLAEISGLQSDPMLATLSPNTYWALIALAENPISDGILSRLQEWQSLPTIQRSIQRLQSLGQHYVQTAHWAGFWDQWILLEAIRSWPQSLGRSGAVLQTSLLQLPIFSLVPDAFREECQSAIRSSSRASMSLNWRTPDDLSELSRPDWNRNVPKWFQSRVSGQGWIENR